MINPIQAKTYPAATSNGGKTAMMLRLAMILLVAWVAAPSALAANITKAGTGTDVTAAASWTGAVAPSTNDVATWDTGSLGTGLTLNSGTPTWLGIKVNAGATDPVNIGSGGTLKLGTSGIDLSAATINATIGSGLTLGAGNQLWNLKAASSRILTVSGTVTRPTGSTLMITTNATSGIGTVTFSPTLVNGLVPWIILTNSGTAANNSALGYTLATTSGGNIVAYTAATPETTTASAWGGIGSGGTGTINYDVSIAGTPGATGLNRNINTLRYTGSGLTQGGNNTGLLLNVNTILNAGSGTLTLASGTIFGIAPSSTSLNELVLAAANAGITVNAYIADNVNPGAVTIMGPNTVTLSAANTFTGNINVNSGTLAASNGSNTGSPRTSSSFGNTTTAGRTATINNGGTVSFTVGNALAGGGNLTPPALTFIVNPGGTLQTAVPSGGGSGNGDANVFGPITLNGGTFSTGNGYSPDFQAAILLTNITVSGTLPSTITTTAANTVANGLMLGGQTTGPNTITFNVADVTGNPNADLTVSARLTDSAASTATPANQGALLKIGAGTMLLAATNTYTGSTTISNGVLALGVGGSLASTNIVIESGATFDVSAITYSLASGVTLSGSGTVKGNVATASTTSVILPGASVGTLTFNNNLDLSAGGSVTFDLNTSASSGNDSIAVGGNLTLGSSDTITLNALGGSANLDTTTDYVLFQVTGSTTMATMPVVNWSGTQPANYLNYTLRKVGNNIMLHYVTATAPTVTATVDNYSVTRNQAFTVTATVTPGSGSIASVTVDLSQVGGSSTAGLVAAGGNVWTNTFNVSAGTTLGTKSLNVVVTDNTTPTPLTGSYTITPFTVVVGNSDWTGAGADGNWSTYANWTATAPALAGDAVTFSGNTSLTPNMNNNYSVTSVTFDSTASSFTIGTSSSTLTLTGGVTNNSANPQTLSVPVSLGAASVFDAASGNLTVSSNLALNAYNLTLVDNNNFALNGKVTGTGNFTMNGTGSLAFGGSTLTAGVVSFNNGTTTIGANVSSTGTPTYIGYLTGNAAVTSSGGTWNIGGEVRVGGSDQNGSGEVGSGNWTLNGGTAYLSALTIARGNYLDNNETGVVTLNSGSTLVSSNDIIVEYAGTGLGKLALNGGNLIVGPTASKWLMIGYYDTGSSELDITNGNISLDNSASIKLCRGGNTGGNVVNQFGGTVTCYSDAGLTVGGIGAVDINYAGGTSSTSTYNLNGGILTTPQIISSSSTGTRAFNFNGGVLKPTASTTAFMSLGTGNVAANVMAGGANIDTTNFNITISQGLLNGDSLGGGLTKYGSGTLTLSGTNTFTGAILVTNGEVLVTPAQQVAVNVSVANGAKFGVSASSVATSAMVNALNIGSTGAATLDFFYGLSGNPTNAALTAGAVTVGSGSSVRVSGAFSVGAFPILQYGSLAGSFNSTVIAPRGVVATLSNSVAQSTLYVVISSLGAGITWTGTSSVSPNLWDLNTTTNWISGGSPTVYIETVPPGDAVTFNDSGSPTVLVSNTVSPQNVTINNTAENYTFSGSGTIVSTLGLTKTGTGSVTLNLPGTYSANTVVSNGTINLGASQTFGNLSGNGTVTNATGTQTVTVNNTTNTTFSGSLQGAMGLTTTGSGILTLTGSNTFTGNLFAKTGTVVLTNSASINTGGSYDDVGQLGTDNATLTLAGTASLTTTSDFNVGDLDSSSGVLNIQGSASLSVNAFFVGSANATGSTASGTVNQSGGSVTEVNGGIGEFAIGGRASTSGAGIYNLSGGTLTATAGIRVGGTGTGTFNQSGGTVIANAGINLARIAGSTGTYNLNGGTLSTYNVASSTSVNATFNFNGGILQALNPANPWMSGLSAAYVNTNSTIDTTTNNPVITQVLSDGGNGAGLTKIGTGTLYLDGGNSYAGTTVVSNGVLAGVGSIAGPVMVAPGGRIGAGDAGGTVGTLTINNNLTIQGGAYLRINKTGGSLTSDLVTGLGTVNYGGILTISNVTTDATALAAGDTFTLFNATTHNGSFASIVNVGSGGPTYSFANGVLTVVSLGPVGPGVLTNSVSGSTLSLSWGTGWKLQMQTNSLAVGLSTNWTYITDGTVMSTNITVNPAKPAVFYRLTYP